MLLSISKIHGEASETSIRELERSLGVMLPSSYRSFLERNNVATITPDSFFYMHVSEVGINDSPDGVISYFYGLAPDRELWDLRHARETFVQDDLIPEEYQPIARDPGGNQICIGIRGEHYGKIYFWDHEGSGKNLRCLADDFNSFLDSLRL